MAVKIPEEGIGYAGSVGSPARKGNEYAGSVGSPAVDGGEFKPLGDGAFPVKEKKQASD